MRAVTCAAKLTERLLEQLSDAQQSGLALWHTHELQPDGQSAPASTESSGWILPAFSRATAPDAVMRTSSSCFSIHCSSDALKIAGICHCDTSAIP